QSPSHPPNSKTRILSPSPAVAAQSPLPPRAPGRHPPHDANPAPTKSRPAANSPGDNSSDAAPPSAPYCENPKSAALPASSAPAENISQSKNRRFLSPRAVLPILRRAPAAAPLAAKPAQSAKAHPVGEIQPCSLHNSMPQSPPAPSAPISAAPARAASNHQSSESREPRARARSPALPPRAAPSQNAIPGARTTFLHPSQSCTANPNASHQSPARAAHAAAHP